LSPEPDIAALGRGGTEQLCRAAHNLVVRNLLNALRQTPSVTEGIDDLP
jgi:hypothetical protein